MNIFINAAGGAGQWYAGTLVSVMLDIERCKRTPNFGKPSVTGNMHKAGAMMSRMYQSLPEYEGDSYKLTDLAVGNIDHFWKCIEWFKRGPAFQDHTVLYSHMPHADLVDILHESEDLPEFKCLAIGVNSLTEAQAAATAFFFKQRRLKSAEYAVEYKAMHGRYPSNWGEALMQLALRQLANFGPIKETKIGNTEITSTNYWTFLDKPIETIAEFLGVQPTQEQLDMMQSIVQNYNDAQHLHIERMLATPWQEELDII